MTTLQRLWKASTPLTAVGLLMLAVFAASLAAMAVDEALGWALRLGLLVTVLGQATGGLMTTPTRAQLEAAKTTRLTVAGQHSVGGLDGGPGLPLTGWSRQHGDIRVAHFVGMHAVQALPAVALLLAPFTSIVARRRAVLAAAAAYTVLFAVLLVQALNGHPLVPMLVSR